MQGFIGKEQDLIVHPVADWQPVQFSPNGCGMSPVWEADDEPSCVILKDLEIVKIPFRRPIQGKSCSNPCARSPGHSQHVPSFIDLGR